jgi:hypothetical protein
VVVVADLVMDLLPRLVVVVALAVIEAQSQVREVVEIVLLNLQ